MVLGPQVAQGAPRVCIVSDFFPPAHSGAGQQAFELARCFVASGAAVRVLTSRLREGPGHEVVDGVEIHRTGRFAASAAGTVVYGLALARTLVRVRRSFDVVHFFAAGRSVFVPLIAARALGKRAVLTSSMLDADDLATLRRARLGRTRLWLLSLADAYVGNSPTVASVSAQATGAIPVLDIPYGVDCERFRPPASGIEKERCRRQLGLPPAAPVCLFVGGIVRRKGVDLLVDSWSAVRARAPDAILILLGPRWRPMMSDEEHAFCRDVTEAARIASGSIRLAESKDVVPYLQASNVFAFPSRREGLPNAILEAMSVGLPLVVAEANWVSDVLVRDGVNGTRVEDNSGALADAVANLLVDPARAAAMGAESRRMALASFSLASRAEDYLQLYRSLTK